MAFDNIDQQYLSISLLIAICFLKCFNKRDKRSEVSFYELLWHKILLLQVFT